MNTTITATLNNIRFQNDTGFMIGMAQTENVNGDFGVLGNMLRPECGMTYKLTGEWSNHHEFGKQFKFDRHEIIKPSDTNGIYKYIVRTAKWVGPTIGQRLVDLYGEKTLEVLRNDPEMVAAEIIGLTEKRALTIQEMLIEQEETESIMVELLTVLNFPGLRKSLPVEIAAKYGSDSIEVLKNNPYVLTEFKGVGFIIADKIAIQSFKIETDSIYRVKAAIEYVMKEDLNGQGSTWIGHNKLVAFVSEIINCVNYDQIETGLIYLFEENIITSVDGDQWFSFVEVDLNETLIAEKIKGMLK